jgi:hypothetical protein
MASPSPCPDYNKERWGVIALYDVKSECSELAGPPRIGAYPGDQVTWRVYNNCSKQATVEIGDLRRSPSDKDGFTYAKTWDQINDLKKRRKDPKIHIPIDPKSLYESGDWRKTVPAGGIEDLTLKVNIHANPGLYTYVVILNGKKPDEGDQDIWPPR